MSSRTRGVVASAAGVRAGGRAGLLAVLAAGLLAGCGSSEPSIDSTTVSEAERATCERLVGRLPATLAGQDERPVSPADALGAAWGDPAIVLTCGVELPEEFDELSSCVQARGVGWFVPESQQEDQSSDITWTAVGYRPVVRVEVPSDYRPEGAASVIAELAPPIQDVLPLVQPCR